MDVFSGYNPVEKTKDRTNSSHSSVEAAALPSTELAPAGLSGPPPLVPNLDGRAFRYRSAVKEGVGADKEQKIYVAKSQM